MDARAALLCDGDGVCDGDLHAFLAELLQPASAADDAPLVMPAPAPAPPYDVGEWRCVDPAHAALCAACVAPPAPGQEAQWALLGSAPGENGFKKLRRLVCATREWRDVATRCAAAAAWERSGDAALAALAPPVRAGDTSELRRSHLLALCRRWRLRSSLWSRRGTKRPASQALQLPARRSALALALRGAGVAPVRGPAAVGCATALCAWLRALMPLYLHADSGARRGERARAAALGSGQVGHCAPEHAAQFRWVADICAAAVPVLRRHADSARRWRAAATLALQDRAATSADDLGDGAECAEAAPAWASLPAEGCGLEGLSRITNRVLFNALQRVPPDSPGAEAVALDELRSVITAGGDIDLIVLSALEEMKTAPLPDYLDALATVGEVWADAVVDLSACYAARAAWMDELWAAHGGSGGQGKSQARPLLFDTTGAAPQLQPHVSATEAAAAHMAKAAEPAGPRVALGAASPRVAAC